MKPKISLKQLNFYFIGLLLALQTVVTYDLRDSWACSSFAKDGKCPDFQADYYLTLSLLNKLCRGSL